MTLILPLAQDVLDKPGPHEVHNRVRKSMIIGFDVFWRFGATLTDTLIGSLTRDDFAEAARNTLTKEPKGPETEYAVRVFLRAINTIRAADGQNVRTSRGRRPKVGPAHHIFPLAQDVLDPSGPHELHNRIRKAMIIAFDLFWRLGEQLTNARIDHLTRADFRTAARNANVEGPGSEATDDAIRTILHAINTVRVANGQDVEGPAFAPAPVAVEAVRFDEASLLTTGESESRKAALNELSDRLATDDEMRELFLRIMFGR